MNIKPTTLDGCFIIEPKVLDDERGYFFESFHQQKFQELTGIKTQFVQDNQSMSQRGVLRGLHFQTGKFVQSKLVRVIKGSVLDVAVDLRKDSSTFGEHFSIILSGKNKLQLFIPRGFAHGFVVLEDDTIFSYKCDNYYNKLAEDGVMYNDPDLHIDWMIEEHEIQLSEKDMNLKTLSHFTI